MTEDLYSQLGISRGASNDEIKQAYRGLAKKSHPDHSGAQDEFIKINKTYIVLSNPEKRNKYDRDGTVDDESVNNQQAQILEIIAQTLKEALQIVVIEGKEIDILDHLKKNIQTRILNCQLHVKQGKSHVKKLEKVISKFSVKGDKPNYIANIITAQINDFRRNMENSNKMIINLQLALTMLEDYIYHFEQLPTVMTNLSILGGIYAVGNTIR